MRAAPTPWPFVGRRSELEHLRAVLADPEISALVLTAPAGAGKTRLAREVTSAAALPPMWWQASPAATGVPFGALASVLDVAEAETAASAFQRLARAAVDAGGVVVVDDAPHLDARSADLLRRLVDAGKATVLATARAGVAVPDWLEWLWLDERTVHHEVAPLDADDVDALLRAVLEGPDAPSRTALAAGLLERTAGNALFLRELLGELRRRQAAGEPLDAGADAPPHLLRVLEARLEAAGPDVRGAVEAVAVLGSLPLAVLAARCGPDAVDAAERAGYLVVDDDARATVRPAHPLHAEAALGSLGPVRARDLTSSVAHALLGAEQAPPADRLRATVALVELGAEVAVDHLVDAARSAFAALDHELAVRLAEAAVAGGDPFEARVVLGAAHSGAGRPDEAEHALRAAFEAAADDDQRARAAGRLSVHLVAHGRRIQEAGDLLDEVLASLTDPQARSFLAADQAKLASIRGDLGAAAAIGHDADDDLAVLNASIVGAYAQAMAGDAAAARATIERGLPLARAHRQVLPWSGELLRFSEVFAALVAEGPSAARRAAQAGLDGALAGTEATVGTWRFLHGFALAVSGSLAAATADLEAAVEELDGHDLIGARPLAIATGAWVRAQAGDVEGARAQIDRCVDDAAIDARVRTQVAVADLWCDAIEGRLAGGVAKGVEAARDAAEGGQATSALIVLHELVRLGAPSAAIEPLAQLARTAPESWLLAFVRDRAALAVAGEPDALARAGRRATAPWPVAAAELAALAVARAEPGDVAAARSALRAHRLTASLGDLRPWTLRAVASPLTAREAEVVAAVIGGATSREVADAAGVSVRTVDNQLAAVYRKLGVKGRKELAALLAEPTG
jgi:DNA-binding CsgD family transcriptional regulator